MRTGARHLCVLDPTQDREAVRWPPSARRVHAVCWSGPVSSWNQSVLSSAGLWNATVCLISPQREQTDSCGALNKEKCSLERAVLSNRYRIFWTVAKPEQVSYSLFGTRFCLRLRDALE